MNDIYEQIQDDNKGTQNEVNVAYKESIEDSDNADITDNASEPEESQDTRLRRLDKSCPYCDRGTNTWCKYNLTFYNHMLVDDVHKV